MAWTDNYIAIKADDSLTEDDITCMLLEKYVPEITCDKETKKLDISNEALQDILEGNKRQKI